MAFAVATSAVVAAARVHPLTASPPIVRQENEGPNTILISTYLLGKHCDGTPIGDDEGSAINRSGTWVGDCELVLSFP